MITDKKGIILTILHIAFKGIRIACKRAYKVPKKAPYFEKPAIMLELNAAMEAQLLLIIKSNFKNSFWTCLNPAISGLKPCPLLLEIFSKIIWGIARKIPLNTSLAIPLSAPVKPFL